MPTYASQLVGISLVGIAPNMESVLRFFFNGPYKAKCEIVPDGVAQISIVDIDDYRGRDFLESCRLQHPERPLILLSFYGSGTENTVPKPLRQEALIEALEEAMDRLPQLAAHSPDAREGQEPPEQAATAGQTANAGCAGFHYPDEQLLAEHIAAASLSRAAAEGSFYDPGWYLQGYLAQLAHEADFYQCPARIVLSGGQVVILPSPGHNDPTGQQALVSMTPDALQDASSRPLDGEGLSISLIKGGVEEEPGPHRTPRSLDTLLWETAIWASAGRLPRGSNPGKRVQLRRWPNMTRFMLLPDGMRIAALWLDHPISLTSTCRMLNIPIEHVYAFYSAVDALGLVLHHPAMQHADRGQDAPFPERSNNRILGRILKRLRSK